MGRRFLAIGRVFSGSIAVGQDINILGPSYHKGSKQDKYHKKIQKLCILVQNRTIQEIGEVPCGCLVGILGIDPFLQKFANICDTELDEGLRHIEIPRQNIIKILLNPREPADLSKFV